MIIPTSNTYIFSVSYSVEEQKPIVNTKEHLQHIKVNIIIKKQIAQLERNDHPTS